MLFMFAISSLLSITDLTPSFIDLTKACDKKNVKRVTEEALRHIRAQVCICYYAANSLKIIAVMKSIIEKQPLFHHLKKQIVLVAVSNRLGLATCALTLVQECIGLYRQFLLLSSHELNKDELENALPEWLFKKEDTSLFQIQEMALKRTVVYLLGALGWGLCAVGYASFPPTGSNFLITVGFAIWGLRIVLNQGLIENPDGGFSLGHLFKRYVGEAFPTWGRVS